MTIKPIPFSPPMVRAILREIGAPGTGKAQTRRVVQPQPDAGQFFGSITLLSDQRKAILRNSCGIRQDINIPYAPSDLLWVREAWQALPEYDRLKPSEIPVGSDIIHNASRPDMPWGSRKRPGMFMPRWASRITLRVTDARCERLQDICEADAIAEGIFRQANTGLWSHDTSDRTGWVSSYPEMAYEALWREINGPGAWDKNPWVWAITFQPVAGNVDHIKEAS